jgi:hypothetical protein
MLVDGKQIEKNIITKNGKANVEVEVYLGKKLINVH